MASPATAQENLRGAGWMTIAMAAYVINDAFIKLVAEDIPLFQAIFVRGLFISTGMMLAARLRGDLTGLTFAAMRPAVPRIVFEMLGTCAYLTALTHMDIANITAVLQVVPLLVTFAAARLLRERVDVPRILAVVVGFVGVMIIVQPGTSGFNAWSLLALLAVFIIVARELATHRITHSLPTMAIAVGTAVAITVMGGVLSLFQGWENLGGREVLLLLVAALFLGVGYIGSIVTIRTGDVSFTAAFRYTAAVSAILLQIVVFQDWPDLATWVGNIVIVAAGLFVYQHERRNTSIANAPILTTTLDG